MSTSRAGKVNADVWSSTREREKVDVQSTMGENMQEMFVEEIVTAMLEKLQQNKCRLNDDTVR